MVCQAVIENRLGIGAKIATAPAQERKGAGRLICVYTTDFGDLEDVTRILKELDDMGLVSRDARQGTYYKSDAYTYLDIYGQNEYRLKASMYSSFNLLAGAKAPPANRLASKKQATLDAFQKR